MNSTAKMFAATTLALGALFGTSALTSAEQPKSRHRIPGPSIEDLFSGKACLEYSFANAKEKGFYQSRVRLGGEGAPQRMIEFTSWTSGSCARSVYAWKDKVVVYNGPEEEIGTVTGPHNVLAP